MSRISKASKLSVSIITMMIILSCVQGPVSAQFEDLDQIVILYDASHSPQFSATNDIEGLGLMLDMVNTSTRYIVKINEDPLNETILNDVDILVIAGPDKSAEFTHNETLAIDAMLTNGSSLFILGNPNIDQESSYWEEAVFQDLGENIAMNILLASLNITGVRFSINETDDDRFWGDTMFDYDTSLNESYPSIIQLDSTTWDTTHPIFNDINSIITMTSTLKPTGMSSSIATGYESSFAQYRRGPNSFANFSYPNMTLDDFEENPLSYSAINGTFPTWLSAFEYNTSKIVMIGSTLMFTGRLLDMPESEEQWFYQEDNSRLFMNILDWLSEGFTENPSAINQILIISSIFLIVGVAFYVFKKR